MSKPINMTECALTRVGFPLSGEQGEKENKTVEQTGEKSLKVSVCQIQ